jgi:hypothetical protein
MEKLLAFEFVIAEDNMHHLLTVKKEAKTILHGQKAISCS